MNVHGVRGGLTTKLRHSRWQRTRACNHGVVSPRNCQSAKRGGCCLQRFVRHSQPHTRLIKLPWIVPLSRVSCRLLYYGEPNRQNNKHQRQQAQQNTQPEPTRRNARRGITIVKKCPRNNCTAESKNRKKRKQPCQWPATEVLTTSGNYWNLRTHVCRSR